jgi:8-oxo-dGTP pyrophosphatase MutT (NUDIX family)
MLIAFYPSAREPRLFKKTPAATAEAHAAALLAGLWPVIGGAYCPPHQQRDGNPMSMARTRGSMLHPHDALNKGACNSEESGLDRHKTNREAAIGHSSMTGLRRPQIVSRLSQSPAEFALTAQKPAAVLIPILGRENDSVLLTLRTDHLESHAGQVCFPGGRYQAGDTDLAATALRESEEEIGLPRGSVAIGGFLDPYLTITGFTVLPVIGFVAEPVPLNPHAHEVAEIFEVPLAYLLDPKNRETRQVLRNGVPRNTYSITFGRHHIWGATAGMIVNLAEKLGAS